ncbi:hypothetical protein ACN47E_005611 [Coniothyrium glycines]
MGGLAFSDLTTKDGRPIRVPRMSPQLYLTIAQDYQERLERIFERVVVPREAPGKGDHGDVDFLVEGIRSHVTQVEVWSVVQATFQAEVHVSRGGSHSFAVGHPIDVDAYVQVDVELCPENGTPGSAELFEWTRFMKGDSDLLQIIGVSHRPLGLMCNDRGFHARIAEIEPYNKKKALVFLTRDPDAVMRFYGLDVEKYWGGFEDEKALFAWATSGRFFSPSMFESRVEKSNDRSRQAKRPMYRRFVEEYMPTHGDMDTSKVIWSREEALQEALRVFGKQAEYDAMMAEHVQKEAEEALWKEIRDVLPVQGNSLGLALKGLRRWVVFLEGVPHVAAEADLDSTPTWCVASLGMSRQELLQWVRQHWEEAKALEKTRAAAAKESSRGG